MLEYSQPEVLDIWHALDEIVGEHKHSSYSYLLVFTQKVACWRETARGLSARALRTLKALWLTHTLGGFDHGVGHPFLLLCNTKAHNYRNNKSLEGLSHYFEWPKVADTVIEAP